MLLAAPGVDANTALTAEGNTPLITAACNGHPDVVDRLLAAPGVGVNVSSNIGATALYVAAQSGHTDVEERLLSAPGVDVNLGRSFGATPSYAAAFEGHLDVVERLIAAPMWTSTRPALAAARR